MSSLSIKASKGGGGAGMEIPEAGNQAAVCVAVIDLGTHRSDKYGKDQRELYFAWELVDCPIAGQNQNHVIKQTYTFFFSEKANLRKMAEAWRGKPYKEGEEFVASSLVGKGCLINVVHKASADGTKTYANVGGVGPLVKGMPTPKAALPPVYYEVEPGKEPPDQSWLPFTWDGSRMVHPSEYVKASHEWAGGAADQAAEDVPF